MVLCLRLLRVSLSFFLFFFNDTATTEIYTLSLHDALPSSARVLMMRARKPAFTLHGMIASAPRSEEHTSELQSLAYLVCRLLLEKKKKTKKRTNTHIIKKNTHKATHQRRNMYDPHITRPNT